MLSGLESSRDSFVELLPMVDRKRTPVCLIRGLLVWSMKLTQGERERSKKLASALGKGSRRERSISF